MNVKDIMREPLMVRNDINLYETLKVMMENKRNFVVVVDENGKFVSEVDVMSVIKGVLPDFIEGERISAHFAGDDFFEQACIGAKDMPVQEFMIKRPKTMKINTSITEAAVALIEGMQSRFAVLDEENKPVGIVTRTELKKVIGSILGISDTV